MTVKNTVRLIKRMIELRMTGVIYETSLSKLVRQLPNPEVVNSFVCNSVVTRKNDDITTQAITPVLALNPVNKENDMIISQSEMR